MFISKSSAKAHAAPLSYFLAERPAGLSIAAIRAYILHVLKGFSREAMRRLTTYREKATDALSALMLFLAVVLAGGYGPLVAQAPAVAVPTQASPADAGTGSHRSSPAIAKQQLVVTEARDSGVAGMDDGKPKPFLAASGIDLSPRFVRATGTTSVAAALAGPAAKPFDARGPPAIS